MRPLLVLACSIALVHAGDLLIRNVNIVDVRSGNILPHRSVLIHDGRIQMVGAVVRATKSAEIVEGRGRYLIPGLWDMHVHLWYKDTPLQMFVAWGVTGVRDMGSDLARVKQWRSQIKTGELIGPHIETCGPGVDGFPSEDEKAPVIMVRSPAEARRTYDHLEQDLNVDFVKVDSRLPRDAYFALIERARKWGLPVAGPVPDSVMVSEAIGERQNSIEHLSNVLVACSTEERKIILPRANAIERNDRNAVLNYRDKVLLTFDYNKADAVIERMAQYSSYQTPTLVMLQRLTYANAEELATDPHLKYVPASIRKTWTDPRETKKLQPEPALALYGREFEKDGYMVDRMERAGVPIMAGTETGASYTIPGYDLHRELQALVKAGLSPLQALRSATTIPAQFLESDESLGTVAQGKIADLVLLDADPLTDIRNTEKISGVVLGGKYLSKTKLDSLAGRSR